MLFRTDWDVFSFLRGKYDLGLHQSLRQVITITGDTLNAQLATVEAYMGQTWPQHSFELLDAIQSAVERFTDSKRVDRVSSSMPASVYLLADNATQQVAASGLVDFLVTMAQQLAWLGAACQISTAGLAYCVPTFAKVPQASTTFLEFSITFKIAPLRAEEPKSCWTSLIGNSTIATGFPVAQRLQEESGLQI